MILAVPQFWGRTARCLGHIGSASDQLANHSQRGRHTQTGDQFRHCHHTRGRDQRRIRSADPYPTRQTAIFCTERVSFPAATNWSFDKPNCPCWQGIRSSMPRRAVFLSTDPGQTRPAVRCSDRPSSENQIGQASHARRPGTRRPPEVPTSSSTSTRRLATSAPSESRAVPYFLGPLSGRTRTAAPRPGWPAAGAQAAFVCPVSWSNVRVAGRREPRWDGSHGASSGPPGP